MDDPMRTTTPLDDAYERCQRENDELRAERDRLVAALTPSADTKAAYHGEFFFEYDRSDHPDRVSVPWTVIKEIMAAISARAARGTVLASQNPDGHRQAIADADHDQRMTPADIAPDEVRMEGQLHKLNGWEAGQMAQQMGREIRERIKPGWGVKRAVLRLSVYMEKDE